MKVTLTFTDVSINELASTVVVEDNGLSDSPEESIAMFMATLALRAVEDFHEALGPHVEEVRVQ